MLPPLPPSTRPALDADATLVAAVRAWEKARERLLQMEHLLDVAMKIRGADTPLPVQIIADVAEQRQRTLRLMQAAMAIESASMDAALLAVRPGPTP